MIIKQSELERMLTLATFICVRNDETLSRLSMKEAIEKAQAFARNEVITFCKAENIEGVEELT